MYFFAMLPRDGKTWSANKGASWFIELFGSVGIDAQWMDEERNAFETFYWIYGIHLGFCTVLNYHSGKIRF